MNIEELTIKQAREIAAFFGSQTTQKSHSFEIGKAYLIRTVTMTQTGRVVAITDSDIQLADAAWIADTGRFFNALENGMLNDIEPFPDGCCVSRGSIVDFAPWTHALPVILK